MTMAQHARGVSVSAQPHSPKRTVSTAAAAADTSPRPWHRQLSLQMQSQEQQLSDWPAYTRGQTHNTQMDPVGQAAARPHWSDSWAAVNSSGDPSSTTAVMGSSASNTQTDAPLHRSVVIPVTAAAANAQQAAALASASAATALQNTAEIMAPPTGPSLSRVAAANMGAPGSGMQTASLPDLWFESVVGFSGQQQGSMLWLQQEGLLAYAADELVVLEQVAGKQQR